MNDAELFESLKEKLQEKLLAELVDSVKNYENYLKDATTDDERDFCKAQIKEVEKTYEKRKRKVNDFYESFIDTFINY